MHCRVANTKPLEFPSTPVHTTESKTVRQKSSTTYRPPLPRDWKRLISFFCFKPLKQINTPFTGRALLTPHNTAPGRYTHWKQHLCLDLSMCLTPGWISTSNHMCLSAKDLHSNTSLNFTGCVIYHSACDKG